MNIAELWKTHREAEWPANLGSLEGELMNLDTVVGGCVRHYLTEQGLDQIRMEILKDCENELIILLSQLEGSPRAYFNRLHAMACLLLNRDPL
jgi:hypothetical protein